MDRLQGMLERVLQHLGLPTSAEVTAQGAQGEISGGLDAGEGWQEELPMTTPLQKPPQEEYPKHAVPKDTAGN